MSTKEKLIEKVDHLLSSKSDHELKNLLLQQDVSMVADVIDGLERGKRKSFTLLPPEKQSDIVMLLSEASRASLLPRLSDTMISRMMHFMDEDNATDILQQLPEKRHQHVLQGLKEDRRKRIEKLMAFDPETAGGLMDLNFIEADGKSTVGSVVTAVREYTKIHKQVPVVFIHNKDGVSWIPARSLISARGDMEAGLLTKDVPSILHTKDREKVLDIIDNENSDLACVVDSHGKILGVIHLNDLLRVAEAEASEDVYRMGAVGPLAAGYLESKFLTIWRKRIGWLLFLFIAELFTFTALSAFESSIAAVTALALFVPLCISTGGNSGSQAATLITRAMALGHVAPRDWFRVLKRELFMGVALGLGLGLIGFIRASLTPQHVLGGVAKAQIGLVIGGSVAMICIWGTLVGSMLPLLFKKLGFDPAYASSPFVATFVDVTGILIYFSIANALILH